jgi:hypothetical protein
MDRPRVGEEPPEKRRRVGSGAQATLGMFGFTKNAELALAPPLPPPQGPPLACKFCEKEIKKSSGLVVHERHCRKNPVIKKELEELNLAAEALLSFFDWRAWALSYAASHQDEGYENINFYIKIIFHIILFPFLSHFLSVYFHAPFFFVAQPCFCSISVKFKNKIIINLLYISRARDGDGDTVGGDKMDVEIAEDAAPLANVDDPADDDPADGAQDDIDPLLAPKKKLKRNRENKKSQVKILDLIPSIREKLAVILKKDPSRVTMASIYHVLEHNTGIPGSTIDKWTRREIQLRAAITDKLNRRRFSQGCGRHAAFPKSEEKVAIEIRNRRQKSKIVTKDWVISEIRKLASTENPTLFAKLKVEDDVFFAFMKRHRFSFRKPSNTKAMTLEKGQKLVRGFFQWLLKLLNDDFGDGIKRTRVMDAVYGRYPLDCRANKDEVLLFSLSLWSNILLFPCRLFDELSGSRHIWRSLYAHYLEHQRGCHQDDCAAGIRRPHMHFGGGRVTSENCHPDGNCLQGPGQYQS